MVRNGENKHSSELSNKGNTTAAALLQRKMSFGQDATLCLLVVLQTAGLSRWGVSSACSRTHVALELKPHSPSQQTDLAPGVKYTAQLMQFERQ